MKYTFALVMTLTLVLVAMPTDQAAAQALGNTAERVQGHKQIRQNRQATADDLADLENLEKLHQRYTEAVEHGDVETIHSLDNRFMNILATEQRESQKEIGQSKSEVRQDKRELRSDRREKQRNRRSGANPRAQADDRRDTRDDRRDLRDDRRDLKVARQEALNLSSIRSSYGALMGNTEGNALKRKRALMGAALDLYRAEVGGHAAERREDRRELREDRRERREDHRRH